MHDASANMITGVRVVRYARDGGYAAVEWMRAFEGVEIPHSLGDGDTLRIGVQITRKRAIDVILRVERLNGLGDRIKARFGRTRSDVLFRRPGALRATVPQAKRPLAVLAAVHMGEPVRVLVCEPAL